jgi:hypothetical protein
MRVSDPRQAASPGTQRLVLGSLIALYIVYLIVAGTGGILVLPVGAFLLLAICGLGWRSWSGRCERRAG